MSKLDKAYWACIIFSVAFLFVDVAAGSSFLAAAFVLYGLDKWEG